MSTKTDDEESEARKLVANERAKLTSTYVNGLAVGLYVVGGVAPIFTYIFAVKASRPPISLIVFGSLVCQAASLGLHLWAKRFLRGLKAMTSTEYLILMSIMPIGGLIIAGVLYYFSGPNPR